MCNHDMKSKVIYNLRASDINTLYNIKASTYNVVYAKTCPLYLRMSHTYVYDMTYFRVSDYEENRFLIL